MNNLLIKNNATVLELRTGFYSESTISFLDFTKNIELQSKIDELIQQMQLDIWERGDLGVKSIEVTGSSLLGYKIFHLLTNDIDVKIEQGTAEINNVEDVLSAFILNHGNEFFGGKYNHKKTEDAPLKIRSSQLINQQSKIYVASSDYVLFQNHLKLKYLIFLRVLNPDDLYIIYNEKKCQMVIADSAGLTTALRSTSGLVIKYDIKIGDTELTKSIQDLYANAKANDILKYCESFMFDQEVIKFGVEKRGQSFVLNHSKAVQPSDITTRNIDYGDKYIKVHSGKISYVEITTSIKIPK